MIKDGAVLATFVDIKATKSRKVAVLWFEIPLEEASAALQALGGFPDAVNPKWVGIAPVDAQKVMQPRLEKPRSYAQQVGKCCNDPTFIEFIRRRCYVEWAEAHGSTELGRGEDIAAQVIRKVLQVTSRADIVEGSEAADKWREIHREYEAWKLV